MNKIAQIIPYFGKWPEWFELYLYSCGRNPMVDFIFYTDCPVPEKIYGNTKFVSTSFVEYCKLVENRLGINYNVKNAMMLCDLRPFFGIIHSEALNGYDWWGFGDIDLIYGDLSLLINESNLQQYDLLTTHNYHVAGHCTFVRNNRYFRDLCLKIPDWQTRLSDGKFYCFDEGEWSSLIFPSIKWPKRFWHYILSKIWHTGYNSFMNFSNRLINPKQHFIEYHTSPAPKVGERWVYDVKESKVISPKGIELPYLHFLFFKKSPWLDTDIFWRTGFYKVSQPIAQLNYIYIDSYGITCE